MARKIARRKKAGPTPSSGGAHTGETGRLVDELAAHRETSPALSGGDVDADWQRAHDSGEEAVGGSVATPDQDVVDEKSMRQIRDIPVGDLMSKPVVTVTPETSIDELTRLMESCDYNAFPVVDTAGTLQGLVSRLDLFRLYLLPYQRFIPAIEETWVSSVGAIMSRGVVALYPVEPALKAMALMVDHRIRTIPIVTDTTAGTVVVGVVTRRNLAPALAS
jgi:CBS domain-containing protein